MSEANDPINRPISSKRRRSGYALDQKHLALETQRKVLTDEIEISERTNLVQAQKFRAALEKAMLGNRLTRRSPWPR